MKQILIGFLLISLPILGLAERGPHSMEDLLQRTRLIAYAKITSHTEITATIHVHEVLHHYRTGIKEGDYLIIQNDFSIVCPIDIPRTYAEQKKEGIFFLSFHENQWYLTMGDVAFINGSKASLQFVQEGYSYTASVSEWKKSLANYYTHFPKNSESKLVPKLDSLEWKDQKELSALSQLQYRSYYSDHFTRLDKTPGLKMIEMVVPVEEEHYASLATSTEISSPISFEEMMEIGREISLAAKKRYPELVEAGIEGTTYYAVYFKEDGSIAKVDIERPVHGRINDAIRSYFTNNKNWPPALDGDGKPVRFKQQLWMKFSADS